MKNLSKNQVVNAVLTQLNDKIEEMVAKIVARQNKELAERNQGPLSERSIEYIKIGLIFDLVKAIEKYTLATDSLKSIYYATISGTIEINATIERDGVDYHFITDVIEAGGYNVQCFHYRYITKTNLPKTGNSEITESIKSEIKKMTKIEKLEKEIKVFEKRIEIYKGELNDLESMTIDQIKSSDYWANITWEEMIKKGADANFDFDENKFNQEKIRSVNRTIAHNNWQKNWKKQSINDYQKWIKKLEVKLAGLAA